MIIDEIKQLCFPITYIQAFTYIQQIKSSYARNRYLSSSLALKEGRGLTLPSFLVRSRGQTAWLASIRQAAVQQRPALGEGGGLEEKDNYVI